MESGLTTRMITGLGDIITHTIHPTTTTIIAIIRFIIITMEDMAKAVTEAKAVTVVEVMEAKAAVTAVAEKNRTLSCESCG